MKLPVDRVRAAVGRLKVFPLPPVALLPGAALPLHIFELRYREMVKDALASDGVFAMAQVRPGLEDQLPEKPALEELVCVGVVTLVEELEDGRYNLVLVGVARARLKRELAGGHLYREFEAELLEDEPYAGPEEDELRQALIELVARVPSEVGEKVASVAARVRGGQLADLVAGTVLTDAPRRLEVLAELDVPQRLRFVSDEVLQLVGRLKPQRPEGLLN